MYVFAYSLGLTFTSTLLDRVFISIVFVMSIIFSSLSLNLALAVKEFSSVRMLAAACSCGAKMSWILICLVSETEVLILSLCDICFSSELTLLIKLSTLPEFKS